MRKKCNMHKSIHKIMQNAICTKFGKKKVTCTKLSKKCNMHKIINISM